jgi:hypothetical protein
MDQPENRREMAESGQQLEQTRENIRNTTEALEQGQTSRALTSGTRAQRELEEMRDEFRRRTAGDFADEMQQMRQDARELAERERQLSTEFGREPQSDNAPPSLRDSQQRDDLAEQLTEQKERLGGLLDRMRDVVQQSEESEPLLSSQLYETMRDARVDRPEEALEAAEQLLRRGFPEESATAEAQARQGIERLQAGVERAAESVLGDETEALRRAQEQLAQLTDAVRNELSQGDPDAAERGGARAPQGADAEEQPEGASGSVERPSDPADADQSGSGQRPQQGPAEQSGQSPGSGRQQPEDQPMPNAQQPGQSQTAETQTGGQPGEQGQQGTQPTSQPSPGSENGEGGQPQDGASGSPDQNAAGDATTRNPFAPFFPTEQTGSREGGGTSSGPHMPLTGEDFIDWSDRMRDVEEMLSDPGLRAEVAAIRERARDIRIEVKRHSEAPDWELVRASVYGPMLELQQRVAEELARRTPDDELVPIDRDPVPDRYAELVREYYERLSAGENVAP